MMGPRRWGWRRLGPGRPPKPRFVRSDLKVFMFMPFDSFNHPIEAAPVILTPDEIEALRLVYFEKKKQEEAATLMGISRGSLWRCLESGRTKLIMALVEGRPIILQEMA